MLRPIFPKLSPWKFLSNPDDVFTAQLYKNMNGKWKFWLQSLTKPKWSHPSYFQIASYNVWFREIHVEQRMDAIVKELSSCKNLVFIGFQELRGSLTDYLRFHIEKKNYRFIVQPPGRAWYGVGLALRKDIPIVESNFFPYKRSCQGRGLLYVQTPDMLLATTHLESFMDAKTYDGVKQREEQIVEATTFCENRLRENPELRLAVIVGDFNWDDERVRCKPPNRPMLQLAKGDWRDAGTHRDHTYDSKENPMLTGSIRLRLDRCIYLTQNSRETTAHLKKLGMSAIPDLTWDKENPYTGTTRKVPVAPSDHFGIAVTFEMDP